MKGRVIRVKYPLVFPFKLSYGTYYHRSGVIVELTEDELAGYGEMSFVPYYGKDEEAVVAQLGDMLSYLKGVKDGWTPWDMYMELTAQFQPDAFLMSAIDCALYDLYGKINDQPVWKITEGSRRIPAVSTLTVTEDDWKEKLDWGWPVLKLKMGFEGDIDLLGRIRQYYDGELRIDANSGWTVTGLEERIDDLIKYRIAIVEQPVARKDQHLLKNLHLPFTLVADESLQSMEDMGQIADTYQVVNIKLQKCGGITPARELIRESRRLGLGLMAGCMTESSVGIGAMAHLASYFDYLDLDGEYLIKADFGNEKYVQQGKVELSHKGGLGKDFIISF